MLLGNIRISRLFPPVIFFSPQRRSRRRRRCAQNLFRAIAGMLRRYPILRRDQFGEALSSRGGISSTFHRRLPATRKMRSNLAFHTSIARRRADAVTPPRVQCKPIAPKSQRVRAHIRCRLFAVQQRRALALAVSQCAHWPSYTHYLKIFGGFDGAFSITHRQHPVWLYLACLLIYDGRNSPGS